MLAVTAVGLSACDLLASIQRLGVSPDETGTVLVHYVPCSGETITRVTVFAGDEETGDILWEARGESGPGTQVFPVGTPPEGLSDTALLTGPLPTGVEVTVEIEARAGRSTQTTSLGFDPAGLDAGKVFTLGGMKDPATYERDALETCES
jgi:hypothetical protein